MPQSIPTGLNRHHILRTLADLDAGLDHLFGEPTGYELLHEGRRYAPKAVIGLACRYSIGRVLLPSEFSGGEAPGQANFVLQKLGFRSEPPPVTAPRWIIVSISVPSSWRRSSRDPNTPCIQARVYRCASRDTSAGACGASRVPADEIEAWAREEAFRVLKPPQVIAAALERRAAAGPDARFVVQLDAVMRAQAEVRRKQTILMDQLLGGEFPPELVQTKSASLQKEAARLQNEELDLAQRIEAQTASHADVRALHDYCAQVLKRLETFSFQEKRLALEALAVQVEANGSGRRGSPLVWRVTGSVPLPQTTAKAEVGDVSQTSARLRQNARKRLSFVFSKVEETTGSAV